MTGSAAPRLGLPLEMTRSKGEARIREVVDALRAYEPEGVYLLGSWARGEADDLSDLDIVVIKRMTAPFFDRLMEVGRLFPAGTGSVDVLVYTPEEFAAMRRDRNAFAGMIVEEGRLIYAREKQG